MAKREFQGAVTALLPRLGSHFGSCAHPVVIAGDLNVVEPGHEPHHQIYGRWEYDFYRAFAANGFLDAYRQAHPSDMDYSWLSPQRCRYRFDYVFCSIGHGWVVQAAGYLHEPRETRLSDHSAMAVRLYYQPEAFPAA